MKSRRNVLIAVLAAATTLIGAQAASAASGSVMTTDPSPGGLAQLVETGGGAKPTAHYLRACDRQLDGKDVEAFASWWKGGRQNRVRASVVGSCVQRRIYTHGRPVYVTVCLTNGKSFCRTRYFR